MINYIREEITKSKYVKELILEDDAILAEIKNIASEIIEAYKKEKKLLVAGNGGSAADAQHIAGELVSKFYFDRPGLPAIALTTDTSIITAIGNDYGYEKLFERQIQANGVEGDVFIGITTSGNSPNIIKALEECKRKNITTVGLTGETGGKIADICDYCIKVPSKETPRIQEAHIMIGHIICAIVEKELFKREV